MEKKKVNKSPKNKTTKKLTVKKIVVKKTNSKKKKGKKLTAFTLIELLAVIIILGVIMIIAIPSVTKYINDSKKRTYVDTAKQIVKSAITLVNEGELDVYDMDATYYIPASCIPTENSATSPFGEFVDAYVIVTYTGQGFDYYWASVDGAHQGIEMKEFDEITITDVKPNIESIDTTVGIGTRTKVKMLDKDGCRNFTSNVIVYPDGKNKESVVPGDLIKIGTEEFYLVRKDGNNLVLLSHYNLKVGDIVNESHTVLGTYTSSDAGYGRQDPNMRGKTFNSSSDLYYGVVKYSAGNYWNNKIGTQYPGVICESVNGTNCVYVYDSNSLLYQYVESYRNYLDGLGADVKEARLITISELYEFSHIGGPHANAYNETSYWTGSVYNEFSTIWAVFCTRYITGNPSSALYYGVRPVIVI